MYQFTLSGSGCLECHAEPDSVGKRDGFQRNNCLGREGGDVWHIFGHPSLHYGFMSSTDEIWERRHEREAEMNHPETRGAEKELSVGAAHVGIWESLTFGSLDRRTLSRVSHIWAVFNMASRPLDPWQSTCLDSHPVFGEAFGVRC